METYSRAGKVRVPRVIFTELEGKRKSNKCTEEWFEFTIMLPNLKVDIMFDRFCMDFNETLSKYYVTIYTLLKLTPFTMAAAANQPMQTHKKVVI